MSYQQTAQDPYIDQSGVSMLDDGGTEILAGHGSFHGTGQMSVVTDSLVVYHYYRDDGQARLGINALGLGRRLAGHRAADDAAGLMRLVHVLLRRDDRLCVSLRVSLAHAAFARRSRGQLGQRDIDDGSATSVTTSNTGERGPRDGLALS